MQSRERPRLDSASGDPTHEAPQVTPPCGITRIDEQPDATLPQLQQLLRVRPFAAGQQCEYRRLRMFANEAVEHPRGHMAILRQGNQKGVVTFLPHRPQHGLAIVRMMRRIHLLSSHFHAIALVLTEQRQQTNLWDFPGGAHGS